MDRSAWSAGFGQTGECHPRCSTNSGDFLCLRRRYRKTCLHPSRSSFGRNRILNSGFFPPYKFLRFNSPLPKPILLRIKQESSVTDLIYILTTALFFGVAILYLRACERLK